MSFVIGDRCSPLTVSASIDACPLGQPAQRTLPVVIQKFTIRCRHLAMLCGVDGGTQLAYPARQDRRQQFVPAAPVGSPSGTYVGMCLGLASLGTRSRSALLQSDSDTTSERPWCLRAVFRSPNVDSENLLTAPESTQSSFRVSNTSPADMYPPNWFRSLMSSRRCRNARMRGGQTGNFRAKFRQSTPAGRSRRLTLICRSSRTSFRSPITMRSPETAS